MKKLINKYNAWKLRQTHKWAQHYANFIILRLEQSKNDFEFDFWMTKGVILNENMIEKYNIFLD